MTFDAPLVLIALVAIPALGVWYVAQQRRRRRASAVFAAPQLAASVTPRTPGWRRHAPALVVAIALAALIVAAARPQRSVAVPVRGAAIMLANDISDSMTATDVSPSRLAAAKQAASKFVSELPASALVGQMAFARHPEVLQSPTTDHALAQAAIRQLAPGGGGTAIGATIETAVQTLRSVKSASGKKLPSAIVLLSDGGSNVGPAPVTAARAANGKKLPSAIVLLSDGGSNVGPAPVAAARAARAAHIPIDTIALGTAHGTITQVRHGQTVTSAVPVSTTALRAIATASGGRAYTAGDAASAAAIYSQLATRLGHKHVKRDLDTAFAGGALALIVAAGGLSLSWFGRLA